MSDALDARAIALIGAPLWAELSAAYASPARAYHNRTHLVEMLARYDEVARDVGWQRPNETLLALVFHDAIYDALAHDNEAKSAEWMRASVPATVAVDRERSAELILLTARHSGLRVGDVDAEAALFLDCDMAIVAAAPARFTDYEHAIAVEYAAVPAELFAAGRGRFLQRLLESDRIFLSDYFHLALDAQARTNLRAAVASLTPA